MSVATESQEAFIINSFSSSYHHSAVHLQIIIAAWIAVLSAEHALCGGPCAVTVVKSRWGKPGLTYFCVRLSDAELVTPPQTEPSVNTGRSPEKCTQQRPKRQSSASQRSSSLPPSSRKANTPSKRCVCVGLERVTSAILSLFPMLPASACMLSMDGVPEHSQRRRLSGCTDTRNNLRNLILCQACSKDLLSQLPGRLRVKVQGLPELPSEFKASLQLSKPCLKNKTLKGLGM